VNLRPPEPRARIGHMLPVLFHLKRKRMNSSRKVSLGQVGIGIVIFATLLVVGFLEAASRDDVLFHQVLNTVRVTMVLFTIAMCFFVLPDESERNKAYWLLFWTISFASYLVHVYFSFVLYFHGSINEFYAAQGVLVATTNLVTTFWWLLDVVLSWTERSNAKWISVERVIIHVLILFTFFLSTVILHAVDNKETIVIILGVLQVVAVLICYIIRLKRNKSNPLTVGTGT
jgi:hypothetical protein